MAMAHSKKNAAKLIDKAKFIRIMENPRAIQVGICHESVDWWDISFDGNPKSGCSHRMYYLDGFVFKWVDSMKTFIRIKVRTAESIRTLGYTAHGVIVPDWWYYNTCGHFNAEELAKYKEQDNLMRGMLNVV